MKIHLKTKLLPIILLVLFFSRQAPADDGYELWLKYRKIDDEHLLKQYRQAVACVTIAGESETLAIIRSELKRSLDVMLGVDVRYRTAAPGESALVIGTPATSNIVRRMQREGKLQTLGSEGYIITSVTKGKNNFTVIAANHDIGLLYGVFHFLRILQIPPTDGSS